MLNILYKYNFFPTVSNKFSVYKILIFIIFPLYTGIIISSGNPIFFGLSIGGFLSIILFFNPLKIVWILMISGLLFAGIIPIWAQDISTKATWGISLLGFTLFPAVYAKILIRKISLKNTPPFIWISFIFVIYISLNSLFHYNFTYESISGFKRYFQATGLLFALAWLPIPQRSIKIMLNFFVIVVIVQLPFALYELLILVPIREVIQRFSPYLAPIDVVAGTFGSNLYTGGANGEMATFLIIAMAFFINRWKFKILSSFKLLLILPFIVIPLLLGETKIVIFFLPLMILVLYREELLIRPISAMTIIFCVLMITILAGYMYLNINHYNLDEMISKTLSYNIYEKGYGVYYLNRTTTLTFWAKHQNIHGPLSFFFGNGLGSAHENTLGHIAILYPGYGIGLTGASLLLWEGGIIGIALFISILILAWISANKIKNSSSYNWVHADASAIQASLPLCLLYLLYGPALFETLTFQIVFYLLLGYLSWLYRYCFSQQFLK